MNKIGRVLLNYLIKGLLIVLPIALSIYIVIWAVTTVDSWLNVNNILGVDPITGASRNIPGLGLALDLVHRTLSALRLCHSDTTNLAILWQFWSALHNQSFDVFHIIRWEDQ